MTVFSLFDPFKCIFRQNCWRKSYSGSQIEHFEKKNFFATFTFFDIWRLFLARKHVFLAICIKNDPFWPFWMPFQSKLLEKKLFSLMSWILWKNFFGHILSNFDLWRHFWPKKTSFWPKVSKWPILTVLNAFLAKTVELKVV